MSLIETESLVLKTYGLSEADRIVVFLTHDHGVIRGVAKGAKRLKSRFGSTLEPFSEVRLTYFQKDAVELVSIRDIELRRSGFHIAGNPMLLQRFAYLTELLLIFLPPHDPNEKVFRLVRECFRASASDNEEAAALTAYFEIWLLKLSGFMPNWKDCGQCGEAITDVGPCALLPDMHLSCSKCSSARGARPLTGDLLKAFRASQSMGVGDFIGSVSNSSSLSELIAILERLLERAAGRSLPKETSLGLAD